MMHSEHSEVRNLHIPALFKNVQIIALLSFVVMHFRYIPMCFGFSNKDFRTHDCSSVIGRLLLSFCQSKSGKEKQGNFFFCQVKKEKIQAARIR